MPSTLLQREARRLSRDDMLLVRDGVAALGEAAVAAACEARGMQYQAVPEVVLRARLGEWIAFSTNVSVV